MEKHDIPFGRNRWTIVRGSPGDPTMAMGKVDSDLVEDISPTDHEISDLDLELSRGDEW